MSAEAHHATPFPRPLATYVAVVSAMGAVALAAAIVQAFRTPGDWTLILALGISVGLCYAAPMYVDTRPDSEGISADDVFAIAAIALLPLGDVVITMAIGALLAPVARRYVGTRDKLRNASMVKTAFNSSLIVLYGTFGALFAAAVAGPTDDPLVRVTVAVLGGFLGNLATRVAVTVAITMATDRPLSGLLLDNLGPVTFGFVAAASYGVLLTLTLAAYDGDVAIIGVVLLTVLAASQLLSQQISDRATITDLLQAAEEVHGHISVEAVDDAATRAARRLLRARTAEISDGPVEHADGISVPVPTHESPPLWLSVRRDVGSEHGIWDDERPLLEALATIHANARDNAYLVERLGRSDATRGALLAALSHDLRSPLAAAIGTARTLVTRDVDAPTRQHLLEGQDRSLTRMDRIITDLIELERAELAPDRSAVSHLPSVVSKVLTDLPLPGDPDVRVAVDDVLAEIEPRALDRVLENLLTNAAKHTPYGGPVWVRAWREDRSVVIAVEDAGPGVPTRVREAIMRPFEQAGSDHARAAGLGLGLFIASRLLALYGARLTVEDRDGGGASFRVRLWAPQP